ncbi:12819_t:CDS:1 [Funneliformis mosseae]|uniref:12819_t:CDS:1 n=1 Tax=Funneliformis mosseae TaxID=27381 RepID=A0A9N9DIK8_FUNMO|nr:12819_t:CDS:1 [Funneliformis mosseae]
MTSNPGLQSISDLTASTHLTTGDIPPPLVGSSTTVIDTRLYLFAGRLVSSRRMTNELYVLDLETYVWTKFQDPDQIAPKARYFHSANQYKNSIVFFGGMGYSKSSNDGLCVLDDVSIFDLDTFTWNHPEISPSPSSPKPRYAHLAAVTANKLMVVGGQDMSNSYIEEINVLDLDEKTWTSSRPFEKHCGAYRSVAVSSTNHTNFPLFSNNISDSSSIASFDDSTSSSPSNSSDSNVTTPLRKSTSQQALPTTNNISNPIRKPPSVGAFNRSGSLRRTPSGQTLMRSRSIKRLQSSGSLFYRLSYTTSVTEENPNPIYLYSNYNFTAVKRELQIIAPPTTSNYQIMDHSSNMTGATLPPGLRFPTGTILGQHLIISGTYLTNTSQTFSIWALNLANLVWTRIDTGSCFLQGSWNRGILCESANKYFVLGHRDRSLVDDYNHRQTNFDHVTVVDLEAFGVYQPPPATMATNAQELGLTLLNDTNLADFEIVTQDDKRIPVNSQLLSQRWPHFKALVDQQADRAPKPKYDQETVKDLDDEPILMYHHRALEFPEPYSVTLAFLQFLYTDHLLTSQQHQPQVLAQLLLLADMYDLDRLRQLASHALHQSLSMSTAALIYETAALSHRTGLQIRALKVMIAAKKMLQQQQQQRDPTVSRGGSVSSTRISMVDSDILSSSSWANPASPPLTAAISSDTRSSYYDPYSTSINLSSQTTPIQTRTRSSSSVSAYSGSISNRGYLPTIQDSVQQNDVMTGERSNTPTPTQRLRATRSNSSLASSARSTRSHAASTTTFGSNNVPIHQQSMSSERVYQQESVGYAGGGLTGF